MTHVVYFRLSDGEIVGQVMAPSGTPEASPAPVDGCGVAKVAGSTGLVSNKTHVVHLATNEVVEKTAAAKAIANAPQDSEVRTLIFRELRGSDSTQIADYPISTTLRAQWTAYRQALRDLSKITNPTAANMLAIWPVRPDGNDASAALKKRLVS